MGPHEPYWRTNTSFSPPPSRWDFRYQSDGGLPYGFHDGNFHGSSTSSNSRESRSWVRGTHLPYHQYSSSDGAGQYFSSPTHIPQAPQWTPPAIQGINMDDYEMTRRDIGQQPFSSTPTLEGNSLNPGSGGSTSSQSDGSDYEPTSKTQFYPHRNFSGCRSFMSKAVHPLSFPTHDASREISETTRTVFHDFDAATPHRDGHRLSSASSSVDFMDVSESFDSEVSARPHAPETFKCGICEKFLTQRSPWSSRRIVRSGDMPVASVLSCCHVFHAECLDQATPKTSKNDPPCPLCARLDEENSLDQQGFSKIRSGFPRLKPFSEDGPSRQWGCVQAGDCVEGALQAPPRNMMTLFNRNRMKKNLSLKGNSSKEYPGKLRKNGSFTLQPVSGKLSELGPVECSKAMASSSTKR